jgi:hypothetical protein
MKKSDKFASYFDSLKSQGLGPKEMAKTVAHWSPSKFIDFQMANDEQFPFAWGAQPALKLADFVASRGMTGGPWPCLSIECRFKRLDEFSRFVALYADQAVISPPLRPAFPPTNKITPERFLGDLVILYGLRPLLEAGLILVSPPYRLYCDKCAQEEKSLRKELARAARFTIKSHVKDIHVTLERIHGFTEIHFDPPGIFFDHPTVGITKRSITWAKSRSTSQHLYDIIGPAISDVYHQLVTGNPSYLSSQEFDFYLIQQMNNPESRATSQALYDGFSHSLPFVKDVPLERLLQFRAREGESFKVYRDAIDRSIRNAANDITKTKQIFNDEVLPELNSIDLSIKNARKLLTRSAIQDFALGAGFLGVGLLAGFVPPDVSHCLTALGGYSFIKGAGEHVTGAARKRHEIRDNKFYFLWKVKETRRIRETKRR